MLTIFPIHNLLVEHPSLRFLEVRAVSNLWKPPHNQWALHMDLLDWLALFFGFQSDKICNQREHLILHLANA
nr:callose synthase 12 [Quercus suber]